MIKSSNHPIGSENIITKDRAVINCALVLAALVCFLLIAVVSDFSIIFGVVGAILYISQLVEVMLS